MSLRADVDRGLEIRAEIEKLQSELKDIEVRVKHTALHGEQVELTDADREGRQYLAAGTSKIVPVIFTSDLLMGSFKAGSSNHIKVVESLGPKNAYRIVDFFKKESVLYSLFDNGKKFRAHASDLLGDKAPAFITACVARDKDGIPKSAIKVMWDETKPKI